MIITRSTAHETKGKINDKVHVCAELKNVVVNELCGLYSVKTEIGSHL